MVIRPSIDITIIDLVQPIIEHIDADLKLKKSTSLYNQLTLQFGANGYQYDITAVDELYTTVKQYVQIQCDMLHIDTIDKQFGKLWMLVHKPTASRQHVHRDYNVQGVVSTLIYLTDGHETTYFSTSAFVSPYTIPFSTDMYDIKHMESMTSIVGTTAIFDGETVHAGPGNHTQYNRYVLYIEMLPPVLYNNTQHDSNIAAVLATHEM